MKGFAPDIIVAVDLMAAGSSFKSIPRTPLGMFFQSAMVLMRSISREQHFFADVVIAPEIGHIRPDQMGRSEELYELGVAAGEAKIEDIKGLLEVHQKAFPNV